MAEAEFRGREEKWLATNEIRQCPSIEREVPLRMIQDQQTERYHGLGFLYTTQTSRERRGSEDTGKLTSHKRLPAENYLKPLVNSMDNLVEITFLNEHTIILKDSLFFQSGR